MTHYYGSINCPHCHAVHYRYGGKTTTFPGYGSPVRLCSNCHRYFICLDYKEYAISDYNHAVKYEEEPTVKGSLFGAAACLALAALIFDSLRNGDSILYTTIAIISLLIGIYLILRAIYVKINIEKIRMGIIERQNKRVESVEAKYSGNGAHKLIDVDSQSIARLSNPNYIRYLELIGVSVPSFFKTRIGYNDNPSKEDSVSFIEYVLSNGYPITEGVMEFVNEHKR